MTSLFSRPNLLFGLSKPRTNSFSSVDYETDDYEVMSDTDIDLDEEDEDDDDEGENRDSMTSFPDRHSEDEISPKDDQADDKNKAESKIKKWDLFRETYDDNLIESRNEIWRQAAVVFKVIFAAILIISVAGTSVISRLMFLLVAYNIQTSPSVLYNGTLQCRSNEGVDIQWLWAVLLMVITPHVFTVFQCMKTFCMGKSRKVVPAYLCIALAIETLHCIGLALFIYIVAPLADPIYTLMMMQVITIIPALFRCLPVYAKNEKKRFYTIGLFFIVFIIHAVGLFSLAYTTHTMATCESGSDTGVGSGLAYAVIGVVSVLLISLGWWDMFVPSRGCFSSNNWKKLSPFTLEKISHGIHCTKIEFIVNLWKIACHVILLFIIFGSKPGCSEVLSFIQNEASNCTLIGDLKLTSTKSYLPWIVAGIAMLSSIVGYKLAKAACKICLQVACFSLPLLLVTPLTFIMVIVSYKTNMMQTIFGVNVHWFTLSDKASLLVFLKDYTMHMYLPVFFLLYIVAMVTLSHVWTPRADRVSSTNVLFVRLMYCGIFFDQSLLMNRRVNDKQVRKREPRDKLRELMNFYHDSPVNVEEQKTSVRKSGIVPMVYACATMWHETEREMTQLLKSIFRMDLDQLHKTLNKKLTDLYEFEAHIFFDNVFHRDEKENTYKVNDYFKQFLKVLPVALRAIHKDNLELATPTKCITPYGGRFEWILPGENKLIVHLKDKKLIKIKKRWSQVMYMYYLLSFRILCDDEVTNKTAAAENTYILALDGDVDFYPESVQLLLDKMKKNQQLGAAAGRIHPLGSGPIIWYQKFEFSISHWLQKATEHMIGCVLCSPGCFSLFRGSALMANNVIKTYATVSSEARHYVQYDMGEDRWLCTLLLQAGKKVEYCAAADAYTFCPEGFMEFYKQRRRWTPSTMANIVDLLSSWRTLRKTNPYINWTFIFYQIFLFISSVLTPGTIFLLIVGAFNTAYPEISIHVALILNLVPVVIFVILNLTARDSIQIGFAAIMSTIYTLVMMGVIVGLLKQIVESSFCSVTAIFFLSVVGIFVVSALLHPQEFLTVFYGIIYFITIPSSSMLLIFYALGNLNNVTWGTRDGGKNTSTSDSNEVTKDVPEQTTKQNTVLESSAAVFDNIKSKFTSDYVLSFGNLVRCICCPSAALKEEDVKLKAVLDKLDNLEYQIEDLATRGTKGSLDPDEAWKRLPYMAPDQSQGHFSDSADMFEGSGKRINPLFKMEQPKKQLDSDWIKDPDIAKAKQMKFDEQETEFWTQCIETYLKPEKESKKRDEQAEKELTELRNRVCLFFFLSNALFVTIIYILESVARSTPDLTFQLPCDKGRVGQRIEPISIAFTLIFGILLVIQFLAMLFHRFSTFLHIMASTNLRKTDDDKEQVRQQLIWQFNMNKRRASESDSIRSVSSVGTYVGEEKKNTSSLVKSFIRSQKETRPSRHKAFEVYTENLSDFNKRLKSVVTENTTHETIQKQVESKFGRKIPSKSLKEIVAMAKDDEYKHSLNKATQNWREAVSKMKVARREQVREPRLASVASQMMDLAKLKKRASENNSANSGQDGGSLSPGQSSSTQPPPFVKKTSRVTFSQASIEEEEEDQLKGDHSPDRNRELKGIRSSDQSRNLKGDNSPNQSHEFPGENPDTVAKAKHGVGGSNETTQDTDDKTDSGLKGNNYDPIPTVKPNTTKQSFSSRVSKAMSSLTSNRRQLHVDVDVEKEGKINPSFVLNETEPVSNSEKDTLVEEKNTSNLTTVL